LRDGAVRIRKVVKINRRTRTQKVFDRTQTSKTSEKGTSKTNDKDKDVKIYKRDGSVKGEDR
jgi:hypothetical protein